MTLGVFAKLVLLNMFNLVIMMSIDL